MALTLLRHDNPTLLTLILITPQPLIPSQAVAVAYTLILTLTLLLILIMTRTETVCNCNLHLALTSALDRPLGSIHEAF